MLPPPLTLNLARLLNMSTLFFSTCFYYQYSQKKVY